MDPLRPASVVRAARALRRALAGADIVHSAAVSSLLPVALARGIAGRRDLPPWVHTEHWSGLTITDMVSPLLRAVTPGVLRLLRLPNLVTAVTDFAAGPIRRARGVRPTLVVPCIVPQPEVVARQQDALEGSNSGEDAVRLIAVGGLIARKDPETAVRTVAELQARGVPAQLTWIGEGALRARVEELVSEADLRSAIRLPGVKEPDEVARDLSLADLFLLPTRGDTFCVAIAEALVHGLPVVAGARGGQSEYLDPSVSELVAEQTPVAYADAVERLLARTRETSAADVAATVGDRFSPGVVADQYVDAYRAAGVPGVG